MRPELDLELKTDTLIDNSVTDFDLYVKTNELVEPILYSGPGYLWLKEELERLLNSGHSTLLTARNNAKKVQLYKRVNSLPDVDEHEPPPTRINSIANIGAAFIKQLDQGEVTEACAHKAQKIARSVSNCLLEDQASIKSLTPIVLEDQYVLHHSIRVACYSVAISITLGLRNEAELREIALGAIFHDIGKALIPKEVVNKKGALNENEWHLMKSHPTKGLTAVTDTLLSQVSRNIIGNHHERLDGTGYPNGLRKGQILTETQVVTISDIFDALTSKRPYQKSRSTYETLEFMKEKMLGTHISPEIYLALVNSLTSR